MISGRAACSFSRPVTLTIPYPVARFSGGMPVPCWYVSQTGTLSQQGITNPRVIDISSALKALRFETTHFTPYYLLESFVDDGGDGGWSGDDGGGGGGSSGGGVAAVAAARWRRAKRLSGRFPPALHRPCSGHARLATARPPQAERPRPVIALTGHGKR
jgi:hypothetical protein